MWILPQSLHYLCAPEPVVWKEDLTELSDIAVSSLMWKSKPLLSPIWSRKWRRVYWIRHLFGRILKPSHSIRFEAAWIASLPVIPVSPSAIPENGGGSTDPRHLWPFIDRGINLVRPGCCWFENVPGHLTLGFDEVCADLCRLGYRVEAGIFAAEEIGATHLRKRLFILAMDYTGIERFRPFWQRVAYAASEPWNTTYITRETGGQSEGCGIKLANSDGTEWGSIDGVEYSLDTRKNLIQENGAQNASRFSERGKAVADTYSIDVNRSREQRTGGRSESSDSSKGMAHPNNPGLQKRSIKRAGPETFATPEHDGFMVHPQGARQSYIRLWTRQPEIQGLAPASYWPARPGERQHEWEEPRTIKPGLGCTINGYNFKEDLLRMYGNGVVPDQAAFAFYTLLNRFYTSM